MKKYILAATSLVFSMIFLTSCGSGAKEITATTGEIFKDVQSQVELPIMFENTGENIKTYYGIDAILLDEFTFFEAEDAIKVDTIVFMKVKSDLDIESIKASLALIIDQRKDAMNNYIPEQYEIACNAVLETNGNFVYLIISKDANEIKEIVESYIK